MKLRFLWEWLSSSHCLMLTGVDPCCRPAPWDRPPAAPDNEDEPVRLSNLISDTDSLST